MKILICPDKFKGSLSAIEAADAIRAGFTSIDPKAEIVCCPIADGGEGTAEILCRAYGGEWQEVQVRDPLGRERTARYGWSAEAEEGPLAMLEMSEASGLRHLKKDERDSLRANTFGTGQLIQAAAERGARRIIVGLGGSATNDGGIGMAAGLGYRFLDDSGREIEPEPRHLARIARIERPKDLRLPRVLAAVDVGNPLLGDQGASRVFGPQKGASDVQVEELENGLRHLADVVKRDLQRDDREAPGAGAAGGLGFGLLAFCGGEIRPGFDLVAEVLELEQSVREADLVITAEGKMESQTLHGKGPAGVAALARRHGKPVIAFAGSVDDEDELYQAFDVVMPITPAPMSLDDALGNAAAFLGQAGARLARLIRLRLRDGRTEGLKG